MEIPDMQTLFQEDKYLNINICILKTPVYKDTGTKICGQVLTMKMISISSPKGCHDYR
ncbi:MAG: hypothetical protein JETT_2944 [Candidatus Jettenia ecosi]|uniref:Uncharacterized protein n=1 Tax=Candidatus Jettenia ecosi TaxID=2494326 RepID=A0A533QJP7_9BACT|nr:MAG: hypothetical protein JETT_2944 [Candidatus Jettenia ecosi]